MRLAILLTTVTLLAGCVVAPPEIRSQAKTMPQRQYGATEDFSYMFERYFFENLELNPLAGTSLGMHKYNSRWVNFLSEAHRQKNREFNRKWSRELVRTSTGYMGQQDRTSVEILSFIVDLAIEGEQFPAHLMPINQFRNFANSFAHSGSGLATQPFTKTGDYDNWEKRARGIPVVIDQAIENMRIGMSRGLVQPRVLMEKVLPQLESQIVERAEDSTFWLPITNFPDSVSGNDRERLIPVYRKMILERIIPAYRQLHVFIRDEYLPQTRESVGMSDLPNGKAWYQYQIKRQTTTDLTPGEIHEIGLHEVARILEEMNAVRNEVGFEGTLEQFFTFMETDEQFYWQDEKDLIAGYEDLQVKINQLLPNLFSVFPKVDYEVRPVEAFRAQSSAGASYQRGAPDGTRSGVFYVNTYNLKAQPKYIMETLSLHEASPGHHFQIAIQQDARDLPMFRANGGFSAFSEGWALYAESLGKDLGLFTDPYQYFGKLNDEMLRAMRLVVDTGLHAVGWTREQAIEYMLANSTLAESDVIAEVERYIAIPGQAVSYKIGQRFITDLRTQAENRLRERFDIRDFHSMVLTGGSMPLAILDKSVNRWVDEQLTR